MYGDMLTTHSSVASHLLLHLPNVAASSSEDAEEILGTPVVFFDTAGCEYFERLDGDNDEGSRCNENEATIVKNWVATLVCYLARFLLIRALNVERPWQTRSLWGSIHLKLL